MSTPTAAHGALPEAGAHQRVTAYLDLYATRKGLDSEQIHSLGTGDAPLILAVSDLRTLLARAALSPASPAPAVPSDASARIAELEAELDDLQAQKDDDAPTWPAWAEAILKMIRARTGYDGYDDFGEGVSLPDELAECFHEMDAQLANAMAAATPAQQTQSDAVAGAGFDECAASGQSCSYRTGQGPNGETQCEYCGATPPQQATPSAAASIKPDVHKPLTGAQILAGWHDTFSTNNPFCPCDLKSFTKAVNWAERKLATARAALKEAPGGGQ